MNRKAPRNEHLDLFSANFNINMIEVLVLNGLDLPESTIVTLYHEEDLDIARQIQQTLGIEWQFRLVDLGSVYRRDMQYARQVRDFVARALREPKWTGSGLEFDRV